MVLPCYCFAAAMLLPCCCHAAAGLLPRCCQTAARLLPGQGQAAAAAGEPMLEHAKELRRLNKKQKAEHWQAFHVQQARKAADQQLLRPSEVTLAPAHGRHVHSFWSMNSMQTILTPPPILSVTPAAAPIARAAPSPSIVAVQPAAFPPGPTATAVSAPPRTAARRLGVRAGVVAVITTATLIVIGAMHRPQSAATPVDSPQAPRLGSLAPAMPPPLYFNIFFKSIFFKL